MEIFVILAIMNTTWYVFKGDLKNEKDHFVGLCR